MFNKDLISQEVKTIFNALSEAIASGDADAAAQAFAQAQENLCQTIEAEFEQYQNIGDMTVLQQRGLRALTAEENSWYQEFIGAVKTGTKQAITNLTSAMPVTIVDRVIEDMKRSHPLLEAIEILDAAGATKLVMNGVQMASKLGGWNNLGTAISPEVTGAITVVDVTAAKYTAYFLIPKDFVKFNFAFAPMWVDQYIRTILSEVVANGLEQTILTGDGDKQFIGMNRDLTSVTNNKYAAKTATAITDWDEYADIIADIAVDGNGDDRDVPEALLVVNPQDNIKKIRKAQNTVTGAGIIDMINLAWPTKVVTSPFQTAGTATVGIAKNYFAAINGGASGIIEYSDENQFLEDNRVYTTRVYGFGRPVDNTSFALIDISGLEAPAMPVKVKGTVKTKEQS